LRIPGAIIRRVGFVGLACAFFMVPIAARAQTERSASSGEAVTEADPSAALVSVLTAACRHDEAQFSKYLIADNAAAFRDLPSDERASVLKRLSLTEEAGRPLLSSDQDGRPVLRCQVAVATSEFQLGAPRTGENLAFIPVQIIGGTVTDFGMVREGGGWRLLSVGLMVFDIRQLASRWKEEAAEDRETAAIHAVLDLQSAIGTYRRAFDQFPESLQQLGPAPKNQVSPERANLIGAVLASGSLNGYRFRYRIVNNADGNPTGYEISATPEIYGKTGQRSFFLDAAGKLHGGDKHGESASGDDPLVHADDAQR